MGKTVLIGLDGATFTILDMLMESDVMPFLKKITLDGVRGELLSTINPMTAAAWPSLMTGRSPGYHGLFDFVRFEERPYGIYMTVATAHDLRCETIWSIASRSGRTVTALNFFGTNPPETVAGYMISGFAPWRHLKDAIYPKELYAQLKNLPNFNSRELAMDIDLEKKSIQGMPKEEFENWVRLHIRREQRWNEVLHWLMTSDPTDLTAIVYDGVDKLQHLCWRLIDPALFPSQPSFWEQMIRNLCLEYFGQIDQAIQKTVALAGPGARVYIVSDHGFGASTEIFYLNVWLQQRGYLSWSEGVELDTSGGLTANRMKNHIMLLDWANTSAYAMTPSSNGVYIRLAKDGSLGGIAPEAYETFRQHIKAELLEYRDPVSGERVVTRVLTREESYPGSSLGEVPDLLLTLRDGGFISILNADAPLKQRSDPVGTHRPNGIFIANGPGIKQGQNISQLSILDIAPLLLYSLDLPIPEDMEGTFPEHIYAPNVLSEKSVSYSQPQGKSAHEIQKIKKTLAEMPQGEEQEILDRLRALGYLE